MPCPTLTIESGIPIPEKRWGKYSELAREMEVDESVLCPSFSASHSLRSALKREGFGAVVRKFQKGYRVWKVLEEQQ